MRKAIIVCVGLTLMASLSFGNTGKTAPNAKMAIDKQLMDSQAIPEVVLPMTPYVIRDGGKAWHLQESFEGSWLPAGWDSMRVSGTYSGFLSRVMSGTYPTCSPHSGTYMVKWYSFLASAGNRMRLITPPVKITGSNDSLSFWMTHSTGYPTLNDRIVVEKMVKSGGVWGAWALVDSFSRYQASFSWAYKAVPLGMHVGDSLKISLTCHSMYGDNIYLDDVAIGCAYTPQPGDLALESIDEPSAAFIESGLPFTPAVTVNNPGTSPVTDFQVIFQADDGAKALVYTDTVFVVDPDTLFPDSSHQYTFADFTPLAYTEYNITAYVSAPGDPFAGNDTLHYFFRTWDLDVGPTAIVTPGAGIVPAADVTPQVTFHNYAAEPADFDAYFEIYDPTAIIVYGESVTINGLAPGADTTVDFPIWSAPHDTGTYDLLAYSVMAYDLDNSNDTLTGTTNCSAWMMVTQEGFEGTWPPAGWDTLCISGTSGGDPLPIYWSQNTSYVHSGSFGADYGWGYNLNGWLRWKVADFMTYGAYRLSFWWNSSYYWHVDPYNNGDLFVKVSPDSGVTWDTLWTFGDQTMVQNSGVVWPWVNWTWYQSFLDLSAYHNLPNVWIGFQVVANDNAEMGIDDVMLEGYTGVEGKPTELSKPASFALLSNYPNPVRGRTTMSFNLPKASSYSLKVYNIAGQLVHNASGAGRAGLNNVEWNTGRTGNGVYFYTLSAGGQSATRKLVIVK